MAQRTAGNYPIDPATTSGSDLADILNEDQTASESFHAGSARPSYVTEGMFWTLKHASSSDLYLMLYDGTIDIEVCYLDVSTGIFNLILGAAKISSTAPGALMDGRIWLDTDDNTLYVYDGTGWVAINEPLTKLTEAVFRTVTASFTLLVADAGTNVLLNPTASMTVTNIADASAPVGYQVSLINRSSQIINLDPSGTQSINGSTATITDCIKPHGAAYLMKVASDDWEFVY